ncbi:hypothetical protein BRD00_10110 [Halobacteriales archaeon QS_8_69_26]|nr:MAG: hypothetical protein BRD00_10110 [Halobacteriales archaeon QS_8_69_26]
MGAAGGAALVGGAALPAGTARADTADKVDVAIYVDTHVHEDHGYDPAYTAQQLMGRALTYNDVFDWEVTVVEDHSFDLRDVTWDGCGDILSAFDDWLKGDNPDGYHYKSDHENHYLLYHSDERTGGCAWPRVGVGWGDGLAQLDTFNPDRFAPKSDDVGIQVTLQEMGHMLGMCDGSDHNCGMHYEDVSRVHETDSLPSSGDVYTTPMGAHYGGQNQCDQDAVSEPGYWEEEWEDAYYWYDCAGRQLRRHFDRQHLITIEGADDGDWESYQFSVSGTIVEKSTDCGATTNSHDDVNGDTVDGWTYGGRDSYVFTGEITDFTADGGVSVYVDCEEVFVDSVGNNTITIDGYDNGSWSTYEFTVAGGLRKSTDNGASINNHDDVVGRTADGWVNSGKDSYRYWGGVKKAGFDVSGASYSFSSN